MARIFFRPTTNVLPTGKHVIISTFPRIFFAFAMVLLVGLSISDAFSIPAPDGLSYFPFQVEAIQENLVRSNGILLGDEMGLGKTISVIGALNALGESNEKPHQVLIIAPKSVIPNWESELNKWLVGCSRGSIGVITAKYGVPAPPTNIMIMNYEIVEKFRDDIDELGPFDVVVCDEAHYLKNVDALRTQATLGYHLRDGIATQRLWLLTGSPVLNNPIELYPLLSAIDPANQIIPELSSLSEFRERYCRRWETPWGVTYKGGKNLAELRRRLKMKREDGTPLMIRRTKDEVLKDLPPKRHQLLPLDDGGLAALEEMRILTEAATPTSSDAPKAWKLENLKVVELKSMLAQRGLPTSGRKRELITRLLDNDRNGESVHRATVSIPVEDNLTYQQESAQSVLRLAPSRNKGAFLQKLLNRTDEASSKAIISALSWARHDTALLKVPYAIELLETATVSHKVVVYAHHRDVLEALYEAFEDRAVLLHGGLSMEERADAVDRFQNDPSVRLFVGSIRAAGLGITLTASSHVMFLELDWSPLIVQQAEDRCHRVGQKSSVLVQYLFFQNTIDEYLSQLLASKQSVISAATDEPKGAASWIFDFGKHNGFCVWDVAGSNPEYFKWVVENRAYEGKEELIKALIELGYLNQDGEPTKNDEYSYDETGNRDTQDNQNDGAGVDNKDGIQKFEATDGPSWNGGSRYKEETKKPGDSSSEQDSGECILTFGKHKGKPIRDVPKNYLYWLRRSGAARRNYKLMTALRYYLKKE